MVAFFKNFVLNLFDIDTIQLALHALAKTRGSAYIHSEGALSGPAADPTLSFAQITPC